MKTSASIFALIFVLLFMSSCVDLPCSNEKLIRETKQKSIWNFGSMIKDPAPIFVKRCRVNGCKSRKVHCHNDNKMRGSAWWKNQNPDSYEEIQVYKDNTVTARYSK